MSNLLLKNIKFLSKIKKFYKGNEKEIIDIILFGSAVKGKEKPSDIDVLLIYKSKIDYDLSHNLKKNLSEFGKIEIISKTYQQLFETSFLAREAILGEGYSLIQGKFLADGLGFSSFVLFKYDLKGLNKTRRMQFYYSLYGRDKKGGMLKTLDSYKFAEGLILTPITQVEKMKEYLEQWMPIIEIPVLIPSRLIKSIIK